jgi:hypothetical protein
MEGAIVPRFGTLYSVQDEQVRGKQAPERA